MFLNIYQEQAFIKTCGYVASLSYKVVFLKLYFVVGTYTLNFNLFKLYFFFKLIFYTLINF